MVSNKLAPFRPVGDFNDPVSRGDYNLYRRPSVSYCSGQLSTLEHLLLEHRTAMSNKGSQSRAAEIRGVITDIRLGDGPDGWPVGKTTRSAVALMPIVYVSGDSAHEWTSHGVPNSVMISKPFVAAQIVTAISSLINLVTPQA